MRQSDAGTGERRRRGALEQQVLGCLAIAAGPMTPAEVQSAMGGGLAYTTVMTTLVRLFEKGALVREADGRAYRYRLSGDPAAVSANVTAHQMHRLLSGANREQVLSRFVADLEPGDEALLMNLLNPPAAAAQPGPRRASSRNKGRSPGTRRSRVMTAWGWGPILVAVAAALLGRQTFRTLPPATAVRLGTALAVTIALMTWIVLAVAAELTLTRVQALRTTPHRLDLDIPAGSLAIGALATLALLTLLAAASASLWRALRQLHLARQEAKSLDPMGISW